MGKKRRMANAATGDYEMITDESDGLDEYFSPTEGEDSEGIQKPLRITMYCRHTHYDIVKEVGKLMCEFHLSRRAKSDWDIAWYDGPIAI